MVAGSDKKDVVEVLVLACAPMNSRQLASPDNTFSTGERVYHFNMDSMAEGRRPDVLVVRNKCVKRKTEFDVPQANYLAAYVGAKERGQVSATLYRPVRDGV